MGWFKRLFGGLQTTGAVRSGYFKDAGWPASGGGRCSDNSCPCNDTEIPRGTGYLLITQDIVDLRHQYPTPEAARREMQRRHKAAQRQMGVSGAAFFYRIGPILVCEQGAKLRNLDLDVAAEDARHWWETGEVPLRATPTATRPT
jgi:hypothetical protein